MKLLCFGDSNTYGYDPRSYFGGRYGAESRWPDLLARQNGWASVNEGENGRQIPCRTCELEWAEALLARHRPDMLLVMLGGNDLLQGASVPQIISRMDAFLASLPFVGNRVVLIAPPAMRPGAWVSEDRLLTDSAALGEAYRSLAETLGVRFVDAASWPIPLTFDGVHFTEEGHRIFAERLSVPLKKLAAEGGFL